MKPQAKYILNDSGKYFVNTQCGFCHLPLASQEAIIVLVYGKNQLEQFCQPDCMTNWMFIEGGATIPIKGEDAKPEKAGPKMTITRTGRLD